MYNFLEKILLEAFPKIKNFNGIKFDKTTEKNSLSYKFSDNFVFNSIEEHYYLFANLPELDVTVTTTIKKTEELNFLIKSLQFPVKII